MNKKLIIILIGAIIIGISIVYVIKRKKTIELMKCDEYNGTTIMLFYAPWCGHCKKFMEGNNSLWNRLKQKYANTDIQFSQIDSDAKPDLTKMYNVNSFPTIIKVKDNKDIVYDKNRTFDDLVSFIDN